MCLPHWGNTLLCDKGFIEQGAPGRVEGSRDATKKISYIAVYGHSKLEYKAPVCLCRFHLAAALGDEEKALKTRNTPISCTRAEGLNMEQQSCTPTCVRNGSGLINSISTNIIMPIYEISVTVIIPIPWGDGVYSNRIIFTTSLLICAVAQRLRPQAWTSRVLSKAHFTAELTKWKLFSCILTP